MMEVDQVVHSDLVVTKYPKPSMALEELHSIIYNTFAQFIMTDGLNMG